MEWLEAATKAKNLVDICVQTEVVTTADVGVQTGNKFKTILCNNWIAGYCARGGKCTYAHGPDDLMGRKWIPK